MSENIFQDNILQGKVAFVTGGGTGITGGVARALAEAGAKVAITSRKIENLESAAKLLTKMAANVFRSFAMFGIMKQLKKQLPQQSKNSAKLILSLTARRVIFYARQTNFQQTVLGRW